MHVYPVESLITPNKLLSGSPGVVSDHSQPQHYTLMIIHFAGHAYAVEGMSHAEYVVALNLVLHAVHGGSFWSRINNNYRRRYRKQGGYEGGGGGSPP